MDIKVNKSDNLSEGKMDELYTVKKTKPLNVELMKDEGKEKVADYNFTVGVTAELINSEEFRESLRKIIRDEFKRVLSEEIEIVDSIQLETIEVPDYTEILNKMYDKICTISYR